MMAAAASPVESLCDRETTSQKGTAMAGVAPPPPALAEPAVTRRVTTHLSPLAVWIVAPVAIPTSSGLPASLKVKRLRACGVGGPKGQVLGGPRVGSMARGVGAQRGIAGVSRVCGGHPPQEHG